MPICAPGEAITEAVRPLEKAAAGLRSATAFRYAHSDHRKVKSRGCARTVNQEFTGCAFTLKAPLYGAVGGLALRS